MSSPLTLLSDEESLFQSTVRRFAREQIAPRARDMDHNAAMDPALLKQLFELGLTAIEIPEEIGRAHV